MKEDVQMYKIKSKKINKIHVMITTMGIILVVLFITVMCKIININIIKMADNKYAEEILKRKNDEENQKIKEEEERKQRIEKQFGPLNQEEIEKVNKIYRHSEPKRVFLTFDDGPTKQVTPYILDLLKQENIKASFFILGTRVESNPALVKREYEEGHFIGNHGYTHKYSSIYSSIDSVMNEYNKTNEAIKKAVGNDKFNSLVFRFPGGSVGGTYNDLKKEAERQLEEKGIGSVDWNALTNDAAGARTKEKILKNFYDTIQGKTSIVLLMHDAADKILTYETLPEIISYLKENGYEFKTMYDAIGRNIEIE